MAKKDWSSVSLPSDLMEELDKFLETKKASKLGVTSRAQAISHILRNFVKSELKGTDINNDNETRFEKIEKELRIIGEKLSKETKISKPSEEFDERIFVVQERVIVDKNDKIIKSFNVYNFNDEEVEFLKKKYKVRNETEVLRIVEDFLDNRNKSLKIER